MILILMQIMNTNLLIQYFTVKVLLNVHPIWSYKNGFECM